jgi:hypothetical protein
MLDVKFVAVVSLQGYQIRRVGEFKNVVSLNRIRRHLRVSKDVAIVAHLQPVASQFSWV